MNEAMKRNVILGLAWAVIVTVAVSGAIWIDQANHHGSIPPVEYGVWPEVVIRPKKRGLQHPRLLPPVQRGE